MTSSSESGAGGREAKADGAASVHGPAPRLVSALQWRGHHHTLSLSPRAWTGAQSIINAVNPSLTTRTPTKVSVCHSGRWQAWTVDVGEKVDQKTMLVEHIKFPCSLGRCIFSLLWRLKNQGPYIFLRTALGWFICWVSGQTLGE